MPKLFHFILIFLLLITKNFPQEELKLMTSFSGENKGDQFSNVVGLGDVNNEGLNDFIVSTKNTTNHTYAKLYFGASPFDTLNYIKFAYNEYSYHVVIGDIAGRGDLNGDGINDFAMITTSYRGPLQYEERVRIFFGGTEIDTVADISFDCPFHTYGFLESMHLSISGDLNGDGYDDLAIGLTDNFYDQRGMVYIYFGGS